MRSFFSKDNPVSELWQWFRINAKRLESDEFGDGSLYRQLSDHLHRIDRGLTYEVRRGEFNELEVSADGIPELIPLVREIVAAAPAIQGWRIMAFRQPRESSAIIDVYDEVLTAENVLFAVDAQRNGLIDLTVYIPGLDDKNYRHLAHCAMMIMESVIGEYDLMAKIGELEYELSLQNPERELQPVSRLHEALRIQ